MGESRAGISALQGVERGLAAKSGTPMSASLEGEVPGLPGLSPRDRGP